jgi:RNA polymerase sigma-70 factor (ECF subfamily)
MSELIQAGAHDVALHLLVLRCQAGDERAFALLMDRFGARTLAYLRGLVGQDAEDVQQDVWLAVYRSVHSLANPGAFRTWLFRTTRHRAMDYLRRRKRDAELVDDTPLDEVMDVRGADRNDDAGVDAALLDGALDAIPPPQREVLLLRYRDDLSYAEIAVVVGCPIGTVRTRLHHAKRRLHELLEREV